MLIGSLKSYEEYKITDEGEPQKYVGASEIRGVSSDWCELSSSAPRLHV